MIKIYLLSFVLLIFSSVLFSQNIKIFSLKVYTNNDQTSLPVVTSDPSGKFDLQIEFDLQADIKPELSAVFKFCGKDWTPTGNIFLSNFGKNIARNLNLEILPNSVSNARYHFKGSFPGGRSDLEFPYSGKWMFFITDQYDTSKIYASGKFYVVFPAVILSATKKNEQLEDKNYFPKDLMNIFNITASFNLPGELYPGYVDHVEIVENHKIDYPVIVDRKFNTMKRQFYWDGARKFSFTARDIQPGNEYRQADLTDINRFNSPNVRAQFDGMEYSRFFKEGPRDHNGGSILTDYKNPNAAYMNVKFSIHPPDEIAGDIFLVGAFNNWDLSAKYRMNNLAGVYEITIPLKRGVYDYQYVLADYINGEIKNADWLTLEGNSWETSNQYSIFLYYKDPNYGGYYRIIGYTKIITR